jgi:3-oxoacyl-[acyl-carrier protein] reductase
MVRHVVDKFHVVFLPDSVGCQSDETRRWFRCNVASAAAQIGLANHEAIAAAKAGNIGITLSAAATYAGRGITINVVAPGMVKSEMTHKLWKPNLPRQHQDRCTPRDVLVNQTTTQKRLHGLLDSENN